MLHIIILDLYIIIMHSLFVILISQFIVVCYLLFTYENKDSKIRCNNTCIYYYLLLCMLQLRGQNIIRHALIVLIILS